MPPSTFWCIACSCLPSSLTMWRPASCRPPAICVHPVSAWWSCAHWMLCSTPCLSSPPALSGSARWLSPAQDWVRQVLHWVQALPSWWWGCICCILSCAVIRCFVWRRGSTCVLIGRSCAQCSALPRLWHRRRSYCPRRRSSPPLLWRLWALWPSPPIPLLSRRRACAICPPTEFRAPQLCWWGKA